MNKSLKLKQIYMDKIWSLRRFVYSLDSRQIGIQTQGPMSNYSLTVTIKS